MPTSQNGYPANNVSLTKVYRIAGTTRDIRLAANEAGQMLADFAAWFDKNIESVDGGVLDDWGYAERTIRGSSTTLSNHASGTAMDLNAPKHPMGLRRTFTAQQTDAIRAELTRYEGCIRWGGDYTGRPDEMHFEINKPLADVKRVLAKLHAADEPQTPAPAPKPSSKPSAKRPTLKLGSKGKAVELVQRFLGLEADGVYGPVTDARVRAYRAEHGLEGGGVGPRMWALIDGALG